MAKSTPNRPRRRRGFCAGACAAVIACAALLPLLFGACAGLPEALRPAETGDREPVAERREPGTGAEPAGEVEPGTAAEPESRAKPEERGTRERPAVDYARLAAPLPDAKTLVFVHVDAGPTAPPGERIEPGQLVGRAQPWPDRLSESHDAELTRAYELYAEGEYRRVMDLLGGFFEEEKDNPFYLYLAARTFFRFDQYREYSFLYFKWQEDLLDGRYQPADDELLIDAWFPDLYWKLANHYLDQAQWQTALEYLAMSAPLIPSESRAFEQLLSYYAEAHYHLGNVEDYRYFREVTLALYPGNQLVRRLERREPRGE